jgi:phosphoserine phosphatase
MSTNLVVRGAALTRESIMTHLRLDSAIHVEAVHLPELPPAYRISGIPPPDKEATRALLRALPNCDHAWVSVPLPKIKVAAFDMDSTLITIECIDEIADYAGVKDAVAAITAAAMRGEITDYAESLRQRVALLAGLPESVLADVYQDRLRLTRGAESLTRALKGQGVKLLLVSGGFTFFTDRLASQLGFDAVASNQLEVVAGRLTGKVVGRIVDARVKAQELLRFCEAHGVNARDQAMAVGDGANDLAMMGEAALSVAHHAKPAVQAKATYALNHTGLDTALAFIAD